MIFHNSSPSLPPVLGHMLRAGEIYDTALHLDGAKITIAAAPIPESGLPPLAPAAVGIGAGVPPRPRKRGRTSAAPDRRSRVSRLEKRRKAAES